MEANRVDLFNFSCPHRRSRHLADRWNLVSVTAGATAVAIRRNQSRTILQRRQSTGRLWSELHVHTQNRYPIECNRWNCVGRWRYIYILPRDAIEPHHLSMFVNYYFSLSLSFSWKVQQPNLSHPFHLHGYGFNVIGIGRSPDTTVKKINLKHALDLDRRGLLHRQYNLPPLKDTIAVPNNGYVVLRFRADNPGDFISLFRSRLAFDSDVPFDSHRFLVIPLPFLVSHCHRNEFDSASRHTNRSAAGAAIVPDVWRPYAADTDKLIIIIVQPIEIHFLQYMHALPFNSIQQRENRRTLCNCRAHTLDTTVSPIFNQNCAAKAPTTI